MHACDAEVHVLSRCPSSGRSSARQFTDWSTVNNSHIQICRQQCSIAQFLIRTCLSLSCRGPAGSRPSTSLMLDLGFKVYISAERSPTGSSATNFSRSSCLLGASRSAVKKSLRRRRRSREGAPRNRSTQPSETVASRRSKILQLSNTACTCSRTRSRLERMHCCQGSARTRNAGS